ncbi:hypothetical protein BH10BAC1_BH10BAC1_07270 [soil metagenome]
MIKTYALRTILLLTVIVTFGSCKKNYTCTCTDSTGSKELVFSEKTTQGKASSKCDSYYNSHYGSVPFNTTTCAIE